MAGIAGFVSEKENFQKKCLHSMAEVLNHIPDRYSVSYFIEPPFYSSHVSTRIYPFNKQFASNDRYLLLLDGEIYDFDDWAQILLERYQKDKNWSFLKEIEGFFSFVLYDSEVRKLYLGTDKFGLRHVFYSSFKDSFFFSSEVKSFIQIADFPKDLDYAALTDHFYCSFVLGNKTLFEAVKLLPAGTVLEYDFSNKSISFHQYFDLLSIFTEPAYQAKKDLNYICELFREAVSKRYKDRALLGASLSGGLDSRCIVAALGEKAKGLPAYTLGLPGCLDERCARKVAQITGLKYHFVPITAKDLENFELLAKELAYYSDGFYLPHESTEKVALDFFEKAPFKIVFRGHGGELIKASLAFPVKVRKEILKFEDDKLLSFILKSLNIVLPQHEFSFVFNKQIKTSYVIDYLKSLLKEINFLSPADRCLFFFLKEYLRRQMVASLNIFRKYVECRIPFLDSIFLKEALSLPITERYAGELHYQIIKRFNPALIKIPNSNTGAPLDAGRLRLFITDKMTSLFKKLSLPGFRHYTEFEKWHRKHFGPAIEKILFDKRTLERGLYQPQALKKVFEAHVSGRKNYARFLGTAAGLEMWFRTFLD